MSNKSKTYRTSSSEEPEAVATDFEAHEYKSDELAKVKRTRRPSPRIGET